MIKITERLLEAIGEIDDVFLFEAETADVTSAKVAKRKRIVKFSVAGLAVSAGIAMVYLTLKPGKFAKAA